MVKRKTVLNKQSIKRRRIKKKSNAWTILKHAGSFSFKCSLLVIGLFAISLLFLSLYQYLLSSPYLRLEYVIIYGVDAEIKNDLLNMADLDEKMSLLAINLRKLKERLETHPWIRNVEMEKHFPDKLIICAEKEVPVALVVFGKIYYVNQWGSVFKELEATDDKDFPVITGIKNDDPKRRKKLLTAIKVMDQLKDNDGPWSLNELSEINVNRNGDLSLYSTSLSAVVHINSTMLVHQKEELAKIVNHLKGKGLIHLVKSIDLNYVNGAVVSFRKG